jgi:hypothetical protein
MFGFRSAEGASHAALFSSRLTAAACDSRPRTFGRSSAGVVALYVMNTDGTGARQLTYGFAVHGAAWGIRL